MCMPTYLKYDLATPVNKLLKIETEVQDVSKLNTIMKRYNTFAVDASLFSYIEDKIPIASDTVPGLLKTDGSTTGISDDGSISILNENPFKTYVVSDISVTPSMDKVVVGTDTKITLATNSLLSVPIEIRYFVISSTKLGLENVIVEAVANGCEYIFTTPSTLPLNSVVELQMYAVDAYGNRSRQLNLTFTTTKPYIVTPTILTPVSRAIVDASVNVAFSATPFTTVPDSTMKLETALWKIYGANGRVAWTNTSSTPYIVGPKASEVSDLVVADNLSELLVVTVFYIGNNISRPASTFGSTMYQYNMLK